VRRVVLCWRMLVSRVCDSQANHRRCFAAQSRDTSSVCRSSRPSLVASLLDWMVRLVGIAEAKGGLEVLRHRAQVPHRRIVALV
jgi:hypothetical protein